MEHASLSRLYFPPPSSAIFLLLKNVKHITNCVCVCVCGKQGVKDTNMLYEIIKVIFVSTPIQKQREADYESWLPENKDGLFTVHMAIVTANLGKRVYVEQGCLLGYMLTRMNQAELACRTDEECNTEIFSIKDWISCSKRCPDKLAM